jgi:hypothetical protein
VEVFDHILPFAHHLYIINVITDTIVPPVNREAVAIAPFFKLFKSDRNSTPRLFALFRRLSHADRTGLSLRHFLDWQVLQSDPVAFRRQYGVEQVFIFYPII